MSPSNGPASRTTASSTTRSSSHRSMWLLIVPFIAMVIPSFFNFRDPAIDGVPFFYWYLLLWIPLTAFLTWIVYRR